LKSLLAWSFVLWTAVIIRNPYYMADLENVYTDHLRSEYISWSFLQVGFRVFSAPLGEIAPLVNALNPHLYWTMHPSLNPWGTVFYFLPFGIISDLGILNDITVHKLMVFSFLVAAYLCVYYFTLNLNKSKQDLVTFVLLPIVFYLSSTYWALNGFYDVVPVLLIILSILAYNRNDFFKGVILLAVAMLMHYRSLVYSPLLLFSLYGLWKVKREKFSATRKAIAFGIVLITGLLDGYTFYLTFIRKEWTTPSIWAPSAAYVPNMQNLYLVVFFLMTTFGVALYLLRKRNVLPCMLLLFFWVYISFIGSWGSWHLLFFFPAVLLMSGKRSREILSLWLLVSVFLLGGLVTPMQVASSVGRMSPQYSSVTIMVLGEGSVDPPKGNYASSYLEGQNLYIKAIPAQGWQYNHMKRNGVEWTAANPGGFLNLHGNETIEVIFVRGTH
jgi:Gpi18-like mannosyltransferase